MSLTKRGGSENKAGLSTAQDRGEADLKCAKLGTAGVRELAGLCQDSEGIYKAIRYSGVKQNGVQSL